MTTSLFGSSGFRGVVNRDITPEIALQLGRAIGRTFPGAVALSTDARDSSDAMKATISAGMMSVGTDVIDLGAVPTPALQLYVKGHEGVAGGVMITASHNTSEYNGVKLILQSGREATREDERALESMFSREAPGCGYGRSGDIRAEEGAVGDYVDAVVSFVDADAIRSAGLTVAVDCGGGATGSTTPLILKALGVKAVVIGGNPDGIPGRESDPVEENLGSLKALVPAIHADLGVAHDSDGGRATFVDSDGAFINGDVTGALVAKHILSERRGKVITPVNSSQVMQDTVEASGGLVLYTEIGSHEIVRKVEENKAVFGVDGSGGMVFPEMLMCRDGGAALAKVLEIVAKEGPLKEQVSKLPIYHMVKRRVDCPEEFKSAVMDEMIRSAEEDKVPMELTDGLRVDYEGGWILVRPSSTEGCIRIYSDSKDAETAEAHADAVAEKVLKSIGSPSC